MDDRDFYITGGGDGGADTLFSDPVRQGYRLYYRARPGGFYGVDGEWGTVFAGKEDGDRDFSDGGGAVADECVQ